MSASTTRLSNLLLFLLAAIIVLLVGPLVEAVVYNRWEAIDFRQNTPSNRQYHSATLITRPHDDHIFMLVFGGRSSTAWSEKALRGMECASFLNGSREEVAKCCMGQANNESWLFSIQHQYWLQITFSMAPEARMHHSAAPRAANNGVVLFGGYSLNETLSNTSPNYTLFNDVWVFTANKGFWKKGEEVGAWHPAVTATVPSRRYGASLQRIEDSRYLLFGGCVAMAKWKCSNATNDLWQLNVNSTTDESGKLNFKGEWTEVFPMQKNGGSQPRPRWYHLSAYTSSRRRSMLIFGGVVDYNDHHGYVFYNDLHEYVYDTDPSKGYWRALPSNKYNATFTQVSGAFNDDLDCLIVFATMDDDGDGQGLFLFCYHTRDRNSSGWWSENLLPTDAEFRASQPFTFDLIGQTFLFSSLEQMVVYGGRTDVFTGDESTALWILPWKNDTKSRSLHPLLWKQVHINPSRPRQLAFHRCFTMNDAMVVVGGHSVASRHSSGTRNSKAPGELNFAWRLNTTERYWEPIEIIGGRGKSFLELLHPNASSLIDFSVSLMRKQLVLFGGFVGRSLISCAGGDLTNSLTLINTTTGYLWTVEKVLTDDSTAAWPLPRRGHSAISYNDCMYVFGGVTETSKIEGKDILSDLWQYNITSGLWKNLTGNIVNSINHKGKEWPVARFAHTATVLNGVMYIFGGSYGETEVNSSQAFWSFDIARLSWKNLATDVLPSTRFFHASTAVGENAFIISGGCKSGVKQELLSVGCLYCAQRLLISESTWLFNAAEKRWEHIQEGSSRAGGTLNADARAMQSLVSFQRNRFYEAWQFGGFSQCTSNSTEIDTLQMFPGCNNGHYSPDITKKTCKPCPPSTYASSPGASKCRACPAYTGTMENGSTSLFNCTEKCDERLCNNRGHCHIKWSGTKLNPMCTSCNFGYKTSDKCNKPVVYYELVGGLLGAVAALLGAVALWKVYTQTQEHKEQTKMLRTSRQEIFELTAAWQIDPAEVQMKKRIDLSCPGGFGEVWLGEYRDMKVAVKTLATAQLMLNPNAKEEMENEMVLMRTLRHPNIVLFLGAGDLPDSKGTFIVMEYMAQGTLTSLLGKKTIHLDREQQLRFALDAARGMRFLHGLSPPRIHRDLKSGNLLISERWVAKVADFGTSRLLQSSKHQENSMTSSGKHMAYLDNNDEHKKSGEFVDINVEGPRVRLSMLKSPLLHEELLLSTDVGTILWKAPEMLRRSPYGISADVYSFGIVLWEILTRKLPFDDQKFSNIFEIERMVVNGVRPAVPKDCVIGYRQLMQSCWADDPEIRPTFPEIVDSLERQLEHSRLPIQFECDLS